MADFSDVAELISGVTFKKADSKSEKLPGTIGVLRAGNIQDSEVIMDDVVYVPERFVKSSQQLKEGDVLIASSSGSLDVVGKAAAVQSNVNVAFGAFCKVARPKREVVFPAYFKHFFRSTGYKREVRERAEGANINNLNRGDFLSLQIPLPPLEEQKRIAGILDEADRVRKKTQALIDKYDELAQSLFLDMFGDPFRKNPNHQFLNLGSVVERIQIGPFGSQLHEQDYTMGGIPLINPKNIISSQIVVDLNKSITRMKYDTLPNYHLSEGDVILGRRGQMGRAAYVGASENGFFCGTGSLFLRPKNRVNGKYLAHVLGSTFSEDYFDRNALGVTMKNLNKTIVSECCVVWPDDGVQSFFLERVDEIEGAIRAAKREESRVSNLFNALLQKAFKGELT